MAQRTDSEYMKRCTDLVLEVICDFYRVDRADILASTERAPSEHRLAAQYLMREYFDLRNVEVAEYFGLSPATVTINVNRIKDRMQKDKWVNMRIKSLEKILEEKERESDKDITINA